jgi:hypothetical protein
MNEKFRRLSGDRIFFLLILEKKKKVGDYDVL